MTKKLEKRFNEIANENKQNKGTPVNVDMSANEIKAQKELTETDKINAFYALNAVNHYCQILGYDITDVETRLNEIKAYNGVYWLYTCPSFSESKTKSEWEKENETKGVVFVEKIMSNFWYKRPFVIGNANGVKNLLNGYGRYLEDRETAKDRELKQLEKTAKLLGVSVEDLLALRK